MRIGRWFELSVDGVCKEHEVMLIRLHSGELGSAFGGTLVEVSQLRIPDTLIESAILLPLISVNLEYQDG